MVKFKFANCIQVHTVFIYCQHESNWLLIAVCSCTWNVYMFVFQQHAQIILRKNSGRFCWRCPKWNIFTSEGRWLLWRAQRHHSGPGPWHFDKWAFCRAPDCAPSWSRSSNSWWSTGRCADTNCMAGKYWVDGFHKRHRLLSLLFRSDSWTTLKSRNISMILSWFLYLLI